MFTQTAKNEQDEKSFDARLKKAIDDATAIFAFGTTKEKGLQDLFALEKETTNPAHVWQVFAALADVYKYKKNFESATFWLQLAFSQKGVVHQYKPYQSRNLYEILPFFKKMQYNLLSIYFKLKEKSISKYIFAVMLFEDHFDSYGRESAYQELINKDPSFSKRLYEVLPDPFFKLLCRLHDWKCDEKEEQQISVERFVNELINLGDMDKQISKLGYLTWATSSRQRLRIEALMKIAVMDSAYAYSYYYIGMSYYYQKSPDRVEEACFWLAKAFPRSSKEAKFIINEVIKQLMPHENKLSMQVEMESENWSIAQTKQKHVEACRSLKKPSSVLTAEVAVKKLEQTKGNEAKEALAECYIREAIMFPYEDDYYKKCILEKAVKLCAEILNDFSHEDEQLEGVVRAEDHGERIIKMKDQAEKRLQIIELQKSLEQDKQKRQEDEKGVDVMNGEETSSEMASALPVSSVIPHQVVTPSALPVSVSARNPVDEAIAASTALSEKLKSVSARVQVAEAFQEKLLADEQQSEVEGELDDEFEPGSEASILSAPIASFAFVGGPSPSSEAGSIVNAVPMSSSVSSSASSSVSPSASHIASSAIGESSSAGEISHIAEEKSVSMASLAGNSLSTEVLNPDSSSSRGAQIAAKLKQRGRDASEKSATSSRMVRT